MSLRGALRRSNLALKLVRNLTEIASIVRPGRAIPSEPRIRNDVFLIRLRNIKILLARQSDGIVKVPPGRPKVGLDASASTNPNRH